MYTVLQDLRCAYERKRDHLWRVENKTITSQVGYFFKNNHYMLLIGKM